MVSTQKLTNTQLEILKSFAYDLPEDELQDFRKTLVNFFANRIRNRASMIWKERNYDEKTMQNWLSENE